ncbi:hypothetical protein BC835DRAFT_1406246 [Cytidiella melzeri]|nr:hypothetical protein BC835DRAFT_1406246 [Cytidiella melzeri]
MDFDLGVEVDHRKRRRNRTTQSCLNCHTSKRKCDRKRPCQRCIQLGLTGLCVYEVDDPALRDDPNIDETTRLRNRIAELESLVRELRGKPHPRWAEPNFCDGDATEKWHSRSTRRSQTQQYPRRGGTGTDSVQTPLQASPTAVKTEQQSAERQQQHAQLYRMSPSPPQQQQQLPPYDTSSLSSQQQTYHSHRDPGQGDCSPTHDMHYSPSSSSSSSLSMGYHPTRHHHHQPNGVLPIPNTNNNNNDLYYHQPYIRSENDPSHPTTTSCHCLTNPAAGHPLISLTHQLESTIEMLRQLPEHAHATRHHHCVILKRITQLNDLMHGGSGTSTPQTPFDALSTPDSELLSPVSTSSHSSLNNVIHQHNQHQHHHHHHQDWPALPTASQYDSYFPVGSGESGMYHKAVPF